MSVSEPLYNFARAFADQGTKNIIPDSNNEASGLASLINVNGSTVGTLSMSWSTTKAGSKGHYCSSGRNKNPPALAVGSVKVSHKAPR
jgi:hypothetical protein